MNIKTLDFDVSNKCGNTCQGCYHNKILTENTTTIQNYDIYLSRFFDINIRDKIDSFALYGGNILENKKLIEYLTITKKYDNAIGEYLFSTTFGDYTPLAKANQKFLLGEFFSDKNFIFQYFFNPEFVDAYIQSCQDLLSYEYSIYVFFSVQLVEVNKEYILNLCKTLRKLFISIGCRNQKELASIEKCVITAIRDKTRTEHLQLKIGSYTFLIMVLHPVRKEGGKISSVCGDSCSFLSSSYISSDAVYTSSMLSIEYDGALNFHNPNCIASLQKICNIMDEPQEISEKLKKFHGFLERNIEKNPKLLSACNGCLKNNIKK